MITFLINHFDSCFFIRMKSIHRRIYRTLKARNHKIIFFFWMQIFLDFVLKVWWSLLNVNKVRSCCKILSSRGWSGLIRLTLEFWCVLILMRYLEFKSIWGLLFIELSGSVWKKRRSKWEKKKNLGGGYSINSGHLK